MSEYIIHSWAQNESNEHLPSRWVDNSRSWWRWLLSLLNLSCTRLMFCLSNWSIPISNIWSSVRYCISLSSLTPDACIIPWHRLNPSEFNSDWRSWMSTSSTDADVDKRARRGDLVKWPPRNAEHVVGISSDTAKMNWRYMSFEQIGVIRQYVWYSTITITRSDQILYSSFEATFPHHCSFTIGWARTYSDRDVPCKLLQRLAWYGFWFLLLFDFFLVSRWLWHCDSASCNIYVDWYGTATSSTPPLWS